MSSGFVIQYRQLGESWNEIALGDGDIIVGRGQDCDLRIDYEGISRHHLKLSKSGEAVWVTDLGSTNGTKIDGVRIQANMQVPLRIGQLVEIGNAKLQVQEAQQPMSIPVQATPHVVSPPQTRVEPVQMPRASSPPPKTNFSGYNLRYQLRNGPWMEFPLPKGEVIIGRYIEADLYLDDDAVSRRHARITISDETVFLQDLGSTNGTLVDGQPLSPRRQTIIQPGQVITIGAFVLDVRKVQPSDMEPATMMGEMGDYMSHDDKVAVMGSRVDLRALNFQKMDRITVGRASDNDVVLSHPLVSRYHALIEKMGGRFREWGADKERILAY